MRADREPEAAFYAAFTAPGTPHKITARAYLPI